jgi:hypothetical protein
MWVEWKSSNECNWIEGLADGTYTLRSGTARECSDRIFSNNIRQVTVIPPVSNIRPRFQLSPRTVSWWGKQSSVLPESDWIYPTRTLPNENEHLVIDTFHPEFRDFIHTLRANGIVVVIDFGFDTGAPSVALEIDHTMAHAWYVDEKGIPLATRTAPVGIKKLSDIIGDYTNVSQPESIMRQHGLLRTHYDPELLAALVDSVKDISGIVQTLSRLDVEPYQHPMTRTAPVRLVVNSHDQIPGLAEYIAATAQLPIDHLDVRELSFDNSLIERGLHGIGRLLRAVTRT